MPLFLQFDIIFILLPICVFQILIQSCMNIKYLSTAIPVIHVCVSYNFNKIQFSFYCSERLRFSRYMIFKSSWGFLYRLPTIWAHFITVPYIFLTEKAMAPHSRTLAWKIPWMKEPGRLQSMGWQRVRHDWATSLSHFTFMHWRRKWQPTPKCYILITLFISSNTNFAKSVLWSH